MKKRNKESIVLIQIEKSVVITIILEDVNIYNTLVFVGIVLIRNLVVR